MPHFLQSMVHFIEHFYFDHKSLIFLAIIGLIAGILGQMIVPGRGFGFVATIAIGIVGAWLGNRYFNRHLMFIEHSLFRAIASATAGAIVLIVLINLLRGGKERDKTHWRHN